jgi:hypothetical protein
VGLFASISRQLGIGLPGKDLKQKFFALLVL